MMPADLSGPDLDRAIAEAMGYKPHEWHGGTYWSGPNNAHLDPDHWAFSSSLDDQCDGPWKMLWEAGWISSHQDYPDAFPEWDWEPGEEHDPRICTGRGGTLALAAARATLAALEAMKHDQ